MLCDILEVMMKPNFESPVISVRQILDRNITLFMTPDDYAWKVLFKRSNIPELREIAETMIITKSLFEYQVATKHNLLSNGTHVMLRESVYPWELEWGREYNHGRGFYRGERLAAKYPYGGYLTSKNWHLNEEFKN